jgi:hypothetical protein
VKKKPARKPAKRKRSAKVQGIPVGGGWIQPTLFPVERRTDAEVRADQDGGILRGRLYPVKSKLQDLAKEILADVQRWQMEHSDTPHRYRSGRLGFKRSYTAEESVLENLVERVVQAGFAAAVERYRSEVADLVARLERQNRIREERRENGELVAPAGRAARKPDDDARADRVCKLYRRIRPASRTNGEALAEVARQHGPATPNRKSDITVQAIRKILKRCGVPCR